AFDARDPSRLLEQVKNEEPPRLRALDPRIPRDLETVVLKAMDKDPARRYPSAEALAEDLHRFLADEPVKARRIRLPGRLWRWCRRNRAVASLTAAVLLLVLTVAVGSTLAAVWLRVALSDAQSSEARAVKAERGTKDQLWRAKLSEARAITLSGLPG